MRATGVACAGACADGFAGMGIAALSVVLACGSGFCVDATTGADGLIGGAAAATDAPAAAAELVVAFVVAGFADATAVVGAMPGDGGLALA